VWASGQVEGAQITGSVPLREPRHERFCLELLKDDNQTQAAIRAGYKCTGAERQGIRLSGNVRVRARIDFLRSQRSERVWVEVGDLIQGFREILMAALPRVREIALGEAKRLTVAGDAAVEVSPTFADQLRAVDVAAKLAGLESSPSTPTSTGITVSVLVGPGVPLPPPSAKTIVGGVMVLPGPDTKHR
jgi:hypothetical protein